MDFQIESNLEYENSNWIGSDSNSNQFGFGLENQKPNFVLIRSD